MRPVIVTVNIDSFEDQDPGYLMYYVSSYLFQSGTKTTGDNIQPLVYKTFVDDGVRFDFTTLEGQSIKLNYFRINDNQILTHFFQKIWLEFGGYCLLTVWACIILEKKKIDFSLRLKNLRGYLFFFLGCLFAVAETGTLCGYLLKLISCFLCLFFSLITNSYDCQKEDSYFKFFERGANTILVLLACYFAADISFHAILFDYKPGEWNYYFFHLNSVSLMVNFLLISFAYSGFAALTGRGIANLFFGVLAIILLGGNYIKMYFQQDLLTIADLYLVKEIVGISRQFLSAPLLIGIFLLVFAGISIVVYKHRAIAKALKFSFEFKYIWTLGITLVLCILLNKNVFATVGLDSNKEYSQQREAFDDYGIVLYYYYMFAKGISTSVPEGYDSSIVEQIETYKEPGLVSDTVRPNVILILAESFFQVDQLPNVEYNYDLFENTRDYIETSLISPSYGGRTAAAEFEALTGYTNYFFSNDVIAYTTYITNPKREIGGLAQEFGDAGYRTVAMHPNRADYYNRNVVYESMGFDEFLDIAAFDTSENNVLKDGFLKDQAFFDKMIDVLEEATTPVFIFGATIEGHSPYNNKYNDVNVQAITDVYSESALEELSAYGQTAYDLDQQMGRLFNYLDQCETPTLVFVFGDHLPPLQAYSENNYLEDTVKKYSVPLVVYSNYSDIEYDHTFSLSQLAPQIIKEAGISHSAYMDFLYQFGQKYPVIHKEFQLETTDELRLYEKVQYDFIFGENYLLNSNK